MIPTSDKKPSQQDQNSPRKQNQSAARIRMLAWLILAIPGMLGLFSGPNSGTAQTLFASLFAVVALTPMLALLAIQDHPARVPDVDLPGVQPPRLWGSIFYVPIIILVGYVLTTQVSLNYLRPIWFGDAERLTRPVADFLPGIARAAQQLRAVGLPERAKETGHYLAVAWILAGTGAMIGFTSQWFTWTDANYLRNAARIRRHWAHLTPGKRTFAGFSLVFLSCLMMAAPFFGEMRHTGWFPYDFSGSEMQFLVGLWYNSLLPFGFFGWIVVMGLYVNGWRYVRSLPGSEGEA